MNDLGFLEKLLGGSDVEWKPLGEVIKLEKGKQLNKELLSDDGKYPAYNGGISYSGFTDNYNYTGSKTIISQGGASAGFVNFVTTNFFANAHCYVILPDLQIVENRYVFHKLKLHQEALMAKQHGAGIPALRTGEITNISVPIPCPDDPKRSLAIQAEIVRILDSFTELTAELTVELKARKKQYYHYRDQLLSFEDGDVKWKALGDIAEIKTGQKPSEILEKATEFDYINAGTTRSGYAAASNCDGDTVTTPSRGQGGIGFVGYQRDPFWLGPLCYKLQSLDESFLINKYLYYFFQSKAALLLSLKKEGGVPAVNKSDLSKLEIAVPSFEEQARIVAILDKFDTLTTSLSEGLPREIKLRQQQYEYYRDLLLSFPKPEEAA